MKSIRIITIVLCCVLIFSFNISALDVSVDNVDGLLFYEEDGKFHSWDIGTRHAVGYLTGTSFYPGYQATFNLLPDTYYQITATYTYDTNASLNNVLTAATNRLRFYPGQWDKSPITSSNNVFIYRNSDGISFNQLSSNTLTINNDTFVYHVEFSTAEGFIDTLTEGTYTIMHTFDVGTQQTGITLQNLVINASRDANAVDYMESIDNKLNNITQNQNTSINITSETKEIIQNIYNYGNNYNQVDQNIINGLGTAEDQLSNAEDTIQNKSQSLVNKVASQWTANKGVASSFLTTITPAASAIGTVTDDFFETIPEEIKNAVITIMLIVFIGWLIGRVEG